MDGSPNVHHDRTYLQEKETTIKKNANCMSRYHLQNLKVPVEMRIKRDISTNSPFNKPTSLKRFDHRAPNSQMEGRGGTQTLPRIHDVFPMKYTVRPEVSQRDTYQLRKKRSLFRLLRIFLIVIQVFLQFQGQCVIITSNHGQNLKKKKGRIRS